jgi:hypothetical protein
MNIGQIFSLVSEVLALYQALEKDGTLAKLQSAEAAIQSELATNENLQKLLARIGMPQLVPVAPADPAIGVETAADSAA